jgi:hypothetical protein
MPDATFVEVHRHGRSAMSEALASCTETFDGYRLGPAADAELRSALADAPPSKTSRHRG